MFDIRYSGGTKERDVWKLRQEPSFYSFSCSPNRVLYFATRILLVEPDKFF